MKYVIFLLFMSLVHNFVLYIDYNRQIERTRNETIKPYIKNIKRINNDLNQCNLYLNTLRESILGGKCEQ